MTNNYNLSFENRTARFPKRIDIDPTASFSPRILPFHPLSRKTIIVQLRIRRGSIPSRTMSGIIIGVDEQHAAKIHSLRVRSTHHRFERHSILGGDTSARDESRQKLTSPSLTIETSNDTR